MPDSVPRLRLLLVEPDHSRRASLCESVGAIAGVEACRGFEEARARLQASSYDCLVTNLRLHAFNGVHLAYLTATAGLTIPRRLVYGSRSDDSMAGEVRRAGAFFEFNDALPLALRAFVQAPTLPAADRRLGIGRDRRSLSRGGRRSVDMPPRLLQPTLHQPSPAS
jgi:hypothetical protein